MFCDFEYENSTADRNVGFILFYNLWRDACITCRYLIVEIKIYNIEMWMGGGGGMQH